MSDLDGADLLALLSRLPEFTSGFMKLYLLGTKSFLFDMSSGLNVFELKGVTKEECLRACRESVFERGILISGAAVLLHPPTATGFWDMLDLE